MAATHDFDSPGYFDRPATAIFDMKRYCERLEEIGSIIEVPKNYKLFAVGDLPDSCFLVKEGRIISYDYTYTGQQHIFGNVGPGAFILLPSIILGHRVTLSFISSLPSTLVRIPRISVLRAIATDPEFALCTVYGLSSKFIWANERFRADSSRSVMWKLCNMLLLLADKHGADYDGKVLIKERCSQQMMADNLHVNRTTIARTIKELTSSGLIERINDQYCIRNIDKLKKHIDNIDMYTNELDRHALK